ncbi:hypothetical protein DI09_6p310 [Mitosporidium daphniae]|uniref:Uncharacterized protein n=1 Tax=Mitosporidium daphniae TaxID=1485682 RepID=A0A098VN03_9MICR|nr:uncharacterized protein DI09_6p310 [Mitosporidium daphniae]KGG50447.1 hypothetical protein DI09_6p310 [Mitosporidium daphniae]|eukprot:XP_013236874.1 uncharacterized protein DI09_6p310 [Mitosporidium daphniae]
MAVPFAISSERQQYAPLWMQAPAAPSRCSVATLRFADLASKRVNNKAHTSRIVKSRFSISDTWCATLTARWISSAVSCFLK